MSAGQEIMTSTNSNESQQVLDEAKTNIQQPTNVKSDSLSKMHNLIKDLGFQAIIFVSCILLGWIVASSLFSSYQLEFQNDLASTSILLNKGFRGIFPSLSGIPKQMHFLWRIDMITLLQNNDSTYQNYTLLFKTNGIVEMRKKNCNGDIKLAWGTFYHNIYIKAIQQDQKSQQLIIPNQQEDVRCIADNGSLIFFLINSSVWTINNGHLYILSQALKHGKLNTYMLILSKSVQV